jgi:methylase of polypeptide subunit release factors
MAMRLTDKVREVIRQVLQPGQRVVDATVGNGYDTLLLARQVFPGGRVDGFDCQAEALAVARERLAQAGFVDSVHFWERSHAEMAEVVEGPVAMVVFNLGYLPGGDQTITTEAPGTITALTAARDLLAPAGFISVIAYPGHPAGMIEYEAVAEWMAERKAAGDTVLHECPRALRAVPPEWFLLRAKS